MQKYTYNVLAKPDGTFGVNITPSHATNPQPYVFFNFANGEDSKSIPFDWNTAKPNLKIRAKYKPKTSSNGGATFGFKNLGDNNDYRFFVYSPSYAFWDLGSNRVDATGYGYNHGVKEIEIGNNYIKDLRTGNMVVQGSRVTIDCITVTEGKAYLQFGYVYINYVQVLDEEDNLLLDLVVKKDGSGNNCLYDRLTGTYYGADWGMTWSEEDTNTDGWNKAKSIDFGGGYLDFTTDARDPVMATQSSSLTSITNVNLSKITKYSGKGYVGFGVFQNYTNLEKVSIVALPIPKGTLYNGYMFKGDAKLKEITLERPYTYLNSQYDYEGVFDGCKSLKTIPDTFDFSRVTDFSTYTPFRNCGITSLTQNLSAMTKGQALFTGCTDLVSVDLGNTTRLTENANMFSGKTKLETVNMSVSSITAWNNMFSSCTNLVNWNIKDLGIETSTLLKTKVTSLDFIANNAKTVTNGEWFVMTDAQYANYPNAVATLQNKGWNVYKESNYPQEGRTSNYAVLMKDGSFTLSGKTYSNSLEGIKKWVALPDSISAITSVGNAFSGNTNIYNVVLDIPNVTDSSSMFKNCSELTSFSGNLDSLRVGGQSYPEYGMFTSCSALTSFTTNNLDNLVSGCAMFRSAKLTAFPYDMPNLVDGRWMFMQNSKGNLLTEFNGVLRKLTHSSRMFQNQDGLVKFTSPIPSLLDDYRSANNGFMFDGCTHLTDFMVAELPVSVMTLNLSFCPVNYDSFVYMAEQNEQVYQEEVDPVDGQWIESEKQASDMPSGYKAYKSNSNWHRDNEQSRIYVTFTANGTYDIYINSFGESRYDYTIAYDIDGSTTEKDNTSGFQKDPNGSISTNYKKVTYTITDGKKHKVKIVYKKDGSGSNDDDRGYILVPDNVLINEKTFVTITDHCTLRLSNTSKALSSTTDVTKWWNLLDAKGYHIEGYTADHTDLPEGWYIDEEGIVRFRSGYTVTFSSDNQSALDNITIVVDGDNNNTNITV